MYLEDKIFYRALTAIYALFMFFYLAFLVYYLFCGESLTIESLLIPIIPLICKDTLIYIAYGKDALWKKWDKSFVTFRRLINHF
ncbi:hypothetical protein Lsha_1984 [Legionella shakespearei DSM 23087]|uniref:Uncharacterized protein n=1 Tax=Legionella shakespearei DSM 23087 TaxID=1122169 RepID=A0A0W0YQW9_9GAMM|nr:hypothetical protein Lsha_1984 [Legionella shakespearei DSM 23087]